MTQFLRRHAVRSVIGAVLVAMGCGTILVLAPHIREQRIVRQIESLGVNVDLSYRPLRFRQIQISLPFVGRIERVKLNRQVVPDEAISELRWLSELTELWLTDVQLSDVGLRHLTELERLKVLNLDGTQFTDAGIENLWTMTDLRDLILSDTKVTDVGLRHVKVFARLETLRLDGTDITDEGMEHLKGLTTLRVLRLFRTQITPESRAMLRKFLPNCKILPEP